jgi:hypothetical protein
LVSVLLLEELVSGSPPEESVSVSGPEESVSVSVSVSQPGELVSALAESALGWPGGASALALALASKVVSGSELYLVLASPSGLGSGSHYKRSAPGSQRW